MDRCGLHRDVDEVRIIIGPKFDMLVKLDNDHEDLIFTEELVAHEVERSLKKSKNLMSISLPVYKPKIADSSSILEADTT